MALLVEQHDGGKVGGNGLEYQVQDAIEEHGKRVVHQQTGGGVRQHPHGAALQEKLGHADGTVRDHAGAHNGRPSADHGVFGLVDIRLVGKGQAETNLAVSHPDDVVLAQVRLAQNRLAVYGNGLVVGHGDNEELALARHDFHVSRTDTLIPEQNVALFLCAQYDSAPGWRCLGCSSGHRMVRVGTGFASITAAASFACRMRVCSSRMGQRAPAQSYTAANSTPQPGLGICLLHHGLGLENTQFSRPTQPATILAPILLALRIVVAAALIPVGERSEEHLFPEGVALVTHSEGAERSGAISRGVAGHGARNACASAGIRPGPAVRA